MGRRTEKATRGSSPKPITPLFLFFEAKPQGYTIEHKPLRRDVLASEKNKASG
jgi:hypothetical protein